ncbi:unnamed protein product [Paramecium primaurelia]|uniref:cathepsin L n=1 Tax=Paramecium primaurelia TaxID=5886 RepID=A0A8S1MAR4_PARPR|nr:unnamed protein product [Paramecium primaurelia]
MKSALIILIGLLSAFTYLNQEENDGHIEFQSWKKEYGKSYTGQQEVFRFFNFKINLNKVNKHNSDKNKTYTMRMNQFSDISEEEFSLLYLTHYISDEFIEQKQITDEQESSIKKNDKTKTSVDWRKITQVKDQGQCAGCWAFGAVGAAEAWFYVKNNTSVVLSEQQLIDCDTQSFGCNGGYQNLALKYIANHGLNDARVYPYTQKQSATCFQNSGPYKTNGAQSVSSNNVKQFLTEYPLVVVVDASNWQFYGGGVFKDCSRSVNHAVLAVGFDENDNWFIKNSWGTSWGEKGFMTLAPGNTCGITSYAYRAI